MKSKATITAVWGSPGSGKSTFSAILARYLTRDKSKAIIISPDQTVPMLPVWFPNENIENHMSLGHIVTSAEVNNAILAERIKVIKTYPFIGVLAYASGDTPLSYPEADYDKIGQIIEVTAGMVDHVILDCTSRMTDYFTPAAIQSADASVGLFTADLRGISYRKAQMPLMSGEKFKSLDHLIFAGNARPYYALDEMEHVFGRVDGILPWIKEIDRAAVEGGTFCAGKYCSDAYIRCLKMVRTKLMGGDVFGTDAESE